MTRATVKVWAVVPAAGAGRRFKAAGGPERGSGHSKLLEPIHGRSILATVIDALEASRVAGLVVVVNPGIAETIRAERPPTLARAYVVNDRDRSEMITSVQLGLIGVARHFLRQQVDGILKNQDQVGLLHVERDRVSLLTPDTGYLICPGDHPGITSAAVDRCVAAFAPACSQIIIATCRGRRGHPIILPADLAQRVVSWSEEERLDRLRIRFPDRVREVETGEPGVLVDVNTPGDLEQLDRQISPQ